MAAKTALFYVLVGHSWSFYHRMAVTSEKPRNLHGRNLDTGMGTHCAKHQVLARFETLEQMDAATADVIAAQKRTQPAIDAANEAHTAAWRAQTEAMKAAADAHLPKKD